MAATGSGKPGTHPSQAMHALVGIASQATGASKHVAAACSAIATQAKLLAMSRPWWAPARLPEPAGLVVALHIDAPVRRQELRPWLWDVEGDGSAVQLELLAGRDHGRWRWSLDLERDGAWIGPLADIVPDLPLPTGPTVQDQFALRPHPGAAPAPGAARIRDLGRPALEGRHVGRTWETRGPSRRVARVLL